MSRLDELILPEDLNYEIELNYEDLDIGFHTTHIEYRNTSGPMRDYGDTGETEVDDYGVVNRYTKWVDPTNEDIANYLKKSEDDITQEDLDNFDMDGFIEFLYNKYLDDVIDEINSCIENEDFSDLDIDWDYDEALANSFSNPLTEENKKKKNCTIPGITYTMGDIEKNIEHFNKCMGTDFPGNDNNNPSTVEAQAAAETSSGDAGAGESSGGEGMGESLTEQQIYVSKVKGMVEIPDHIKLLKRSDVENFVIALRPEEEFIVGYVTPIFFYPQLVNAFTLIKCTEMSGYTGVDYIEVRDDGKDHSHIIQQANDQEARGGEGTHGDRKPYLGRQADYSAQYAVTNRIVKQKWSKDADQLAAAAGTNKEVLDNTILFYPKTGTAPHVTYYIDVHNGKGFRKAPREILERTIFEKLAHYDDPKYNKRRWTDADLVKKIKDQLESDARTISSVVFDSEDKAETRSAFGDNGHRGIIKPQVRALYTNQLYWLSKDNIDIGAPLNESLTEASKRDIKRYYVRPQNLFCSNKDDILRTLADLDGQNCSIYTLKNLENHNDIHKLTNKDIIYYYDDRVLYDKNHVQVLDYDLFVKHEEERKSLDADRVSDSEFVKNYDDRMTDLTNDDDTIREDLKEGQESMNANYEEAANNLDRFMEDDETGEIFDRFYDIRTADEMVEFLKDHMIDEEEFYDIAGDGATIEEFARYIIDNKVNSLDEEFFCSFDNVKSRLHEDIDSDDVCCICGEPINGYGNNPYPYKKEGRCCDACNWKFVIPARLDAMNNRDRADESLDK